MNANIMKTQFFYKMKYDHKLKAWRGSMIFLLFDLLTTLTFVLMETFGPCLLYKNYISKGYILVRSIFFFLLLMSFYVIIKGQDFIHSKYKYVNLCGNNLISRCCYCCYYDTGLLYRLNHLSNYSL